jgi:hypothetical protein
MDNFALKGASVILLLSGCTQPDGKEAEPADVPLARLPDSMEGDGSAIPGVLGQAGSCVTIRTDDGRTVLLASTNPDIMWDSAAKELRAGAVVIRVGQRVEIGGSMSAKGTKLDWKLAPAADCPQDAIWIMASMKPG